MVLKNEVTDDKYFRVIFFGAWVIPWSVSPLVFALNNPVNSAPSQLPLYVFIREQVMI